ncbi:MAG TPA: M23 family metallopeptidase [Bacteroidota bacterium]|jgi:murein DD-endopeptidase MepM/ murein hydrolase activator NlpD|nr:M23 family metallopeptidase [Bacteroidota bacterium]
MTSENVRERKKKRRFTLVFVPDSESEQPRSFSFSKWKLIASLSAAFFGIIALMALILIYTPARLLLPVSHSDMEQLYGTQIVAIQNQVTALYKELTTLRSYNLQLRKAMGEEISSNDSSLIARRKNDQAPGKELVKEEHSSSAAEGKKFVDVVKQSAAPPEAQVLPEPPARSNQKSIEDIFPLTLPVNGYVSRGFDATNYHYGLDFVSSASSPVLAAADGKIVFAGWTYDDGLMVIMAHDLGYMTVYKHNEALTMNTGATVKRGEVIALLGNTGKTSSGPHLHFEIWKNGTPYDPANYLLITQ